MISQLKELLLNDDGATLVEYAIVVGLIALVCIAAVTTIGKNVKTVFTNIGDDV